MEAICFATEFFLTEFPVADELKGMPPVSACSALLSCDEDLLPFRGGLCRPLVSSLLAVICKLLLGEDDSEWL